MSLLISVNLKLWLFKYWRGNKFFFFFFFQQEFKQLFGCWNTRWGILLFTDTQNQILIVSRHHTKKEKKRFWLTQNYSFLFSEPWRTRKMLPFSKNLFCTQAKELPALKPIKRRAERVDEMMKEIRGTTTAKEAPLSVHTCDLVI